MLKVFKIRKKLSIFLSSLLFVNMIYLGTTKTNALAEDKGISLNSVTVESKYVSPGGSNKLVIDASTGTAASLADEANALYVMKTGEEEKEIEVSLPLVNGKYEGKVDIPDSNYLGNWQLSYVIVGDKNGDTQIFYNSAVNSGVGIDLSSADFKAGDDNAGPTFEAISVNKNKVTKLSSVNIQIKASDVDSGLAKEANLLYVLKNSNGEDEEKEVTLALKDGHYEGNLDIDEKFTAGTWQVSFITLNDNVGNVSVVYNSKLHGDGLGKDLSAGQFEVTEDKESPVLNSIEVDKKFVKKGDTVKIKAKAQDQSGLANEANALYVINTVGEPIEKEVSLKLNGDTYEGELTIDDSFTSGTAKLSFIVMQDILDNIGIIYNSDVNAGVGVNLSSADFVVDLIAPGAPNVKLSTEEPTNKDVAVSIASEDTEAKIQYKLKENAEWIDYVGSFNITENTNIYARAMDKAGNVGETVIKEVKNIDKVPPVVTVTGVENKAVYSRAVKPVVTTEDLNSVAVTELLNDKAYNGEEITAEGNYTLKVTAIDKAGNITEVVKAFVIDRTAPSLSIEGVENNGLYNNTVNPKVIADDKDAVVTLTLNGNPYNGEPIGAEGNYTLKATAVDKVGNQSETSISFAIDKTAPTVNIAGVEDRAIYNKSVKATVTTEDVNPVTVTELLNDKAYNGEDITAEGSYTLKITAVDKAGNVNEVVKNFVIDKSAPALSISGVENNGLYNKAVNPKVIVDDKDAVVTTTLNGKPYSGEVISEEGSYVLKATVIDKAGNKSDMSITFVIDKTAPTIKVSGVADGKSYDNSIVIATIETDDKAASVSVHLDSNPVTLTAEGKIAIGAEGSHTLVVKAVDKAGNSFEKTINFTLSLSVTADGKSTADAIKAAINNSKAGAPIVVNAVSNPVIKQEVLSAIKGIDKDVTFVVESQGITLQYTINGKDITDISKDVDLTLNPSAPNGKVISKIASDAQIISFRYEGILPAPIKVRIPVDSNKLDSTKPIYFYYYNSSTKNTELVGDKLTAYKVGNQYYVDVVIKHCSDYFLTNKDNATVTKRVETLVKTGSIIDSNALILLGLLAVGFGAVVFAATKRKTANPK